MRIVPSLALLASALCLSQGDREQPATAYQVDHGDTSHLALLERLDDVNDEVRGAPTATFDCAMRQLALRYARQLQPDRAELDFQRIADALNGSPRAKENNCSASLGTLNVTKGKQAPSFPIPENATTIFVDYANGDDKNPGSKEKPLRTLAQAVSEAKDPTKLPVVILLRAGTHFILDEAVMLEEGTSDLIIQNYDGEEVWLSGGIPISPTWREYNVSELPTWVVEHDENAFYGRRPGGHIHINGTYDSWTQCETMCRENGSCLVWTWVPPTYKGYRNTCWFNEQRDWAPTPEQGIVSGYQQAAKNVYSADLSGLNIQTVPGLRINSRRAIRARFPNADPELGFGSELRPSAWLKPTSPSRADRTFAPPTPFRNSSDSFQLYSVGIQGACNMYDPPVSYWCGPDNITRGHGTYMPRSPSGFVAGHDLLPNSPYADASAAIVHALAFGNHWFSWAFEVERYNATSGEFFFGRGGHQGPQGTDVGEQMYIENVFEELDSPGEWFFNETTQTLFLWHNGTGKPPLDTDFVVTSQKTLILAKGEQDKPIRNLQIRGVNFRDTAYAYLDPRAVPSDDWTLQSSAALVLQGTENSTVDSCVFERLDGNAILIFGYNRHTTVQNCEFAWIGDTAIASWGITQGLPGMTGVGWDGTDGNHPRYNQILSNIAREFGIWQKQSSFYFQAKSCLNTIRNNVVYNGPRAGVNFNDGFGGGSNLTHNVVFNMCRETADHGPFNSWDKQVRA